MNGSFLVLFFFLNLCGFPHSKQKYSAYTIGDVSVQPVHKCVPGLVRGQGSWCWLENLQNGLPGCLGQNVLIKVKPRKFQTVDSDMTGALINGRLYLL